MGIYNASNARPHPNPEPSEPTELSSGGRSIRAWIMVSDDDSFDRILDKAEELGATILWRNHFWTEFGGANASFVDPWGNQINLWQHLEGVEVDEDTHQVIGGGINPRRLDYRIKEKLLNASKNMTDKPHMMFIPQNRVGLMWHYG